MEQICIKYNETELNGFLNPLQVNFGQGKILIQSYSDLDGVRRGLLLYETDESHPIGIPLPDLQLKTPHHPQKGEIYLSFSNVESAESFRAELDEVIKGFLQEKLANVIKSTTT